MSDGNPQVEARVLSDHAAPLATARPAQPCHTSDLVIPIRQHQVIPVGTRTPNIWLNIFSWEISQPCTTGTYEERVDITPCDVQEKIGMQGV